MATALQMFLDEHGEELMRRNLYRNFLLHLCNLYDFGVVTPAVVLSVARECFPKTASGKIQRAQLRAALDAHWALNDVVGRVVQHLL